MAQFHALRSQALSLYKKLQAEDDEKAAIDRRAQLAATLEQRCAEQRSFVEQRSVQLDAHAEDGRRALTAMANAVRSSESKEDERASGEAAALDALTEQLCNLAPFAAKTSARADAARTSAEALLADVARHHDRIEVREKKIARMEGEATDAEAKARAALESEEAVAAALAAASKKKARAEATLAAALESEARTRDARAAAAAAKAAASLDAATKVASAASAAQTHQARCKELDAMEKTETLVSARASYESKVASLRTELVPLRAAATEATRAARVAADEATALAAATRARALELEASAAAEDSARALLVTAESVAERRAASAALQRQVAAASAARDTQEAQRDELAREVETQRESLAAAQDQLKVRGVLESSLLVRLACYSHRPHPMPVSSLTPPPRTLQHAESAAESAKADAATVASTFNSQSDAVAEKSNEKIDAEASLARAKSAFDEHAKSVKAAKAAAKAQSAEEAKALVAARATQLETIDALKATEKTNGEMESVISAKRSEIARLEAALQQATAAAASDM